MRNTDRRFVRTEKVIQETMMRILIEEDPESITVDQLIGEADINKSTFYLHYQSLDQLVSSLEDQLISELSSALYRLDNTHTIDDFFNAVMNWCSSNKALTQAVLKASTYRFNEKIENLFKKYLKPLKPIKRNKITDENAFLVPSLIQAEVGVLRVWIMDGCRFNRDVILNQCVSIVKTDIYFQIIGK